MMDRDRQSHDERSTTVGGLLEPLSDLDPALVYAVVGALVLAESALFIGFVLPGELSVLLAGMLASIGRIELVPLIVLVIAAAVLGDALGFYIGRRVGPPLLQHRWLVRHEARIATFQTFMDRRGGLAVVVGRLTAMLRALTPPLAGISGMRWRKYLPYNLAGGVIWGGGVCVLGYVAGASYARVADLLGQVGAVAVAFLVVGGIVAWQVRRRRSVTAGH